MSRPLSDPDALNALAELPSPALVIDLAAADRNVARAAAFFGEYVGRRGWPALRPHFKAHRCTTLLRRQLAAGSCSGVTCATAAEAEVLAAAGFDDVLLANEVIAPRGLESVVRAAAATRLTLCVDDPHQVRALAGAAAAAGVGLGVLIEIDVGQGRCGVPPGNGLLLALAREIDAAPGLELRGLQGYDGHVMLARSREERSAQVERSAAILDAERVRLREHGVASPLLSGGGTGTFDLAADAGVLEEVQAGSYVLMDARYAELGLPFENALLCRATVISRHGARVVLDAGLKAMSAEYGLPRCLTPGLEVTELADEHATAVAGPLARVEVGDVVLLVPGHVDPTMNLHPVVFAVDAEGAVHEWAVDGRAGRVVGPQDDLREGRGMADSVDVLIQDLQRYAASQRALADASEVTARTARAEVARIEEALKALGQRPPDAAPAAPRPRPEVSSASSAPRARRGENQTKVLALVSDRPGVTPGEIAQTTGVKQAVVYNVLRTLDGRGQVERTDLGGGRTGYRVPAEPSSPAPSAPVAAEMPEPEPEPESAAEPAPPVNDEPAPDPAAIRWRRPANGD